MIKAATFRTTLLALIGSLSAAAFAIADTPKQIDIPAGELSDALIRLSKQYGIDLFYRPEQVKGLKTQGVQGELTTEEAIARLIKGTPLKLSTDSTGAMVIGVPEAGGARSTAVNTDVSSAVGSEADAAGMRVVQAEASSAANSFSGSGETGRVKQNASGSEENLESGNLEEIVVTAQKRVERLIEVPQAVTVLSADDLTKMGATEFRDFASSVPGLSFITAGAGYTTITLRGVTTGNDVSPTVGIYVDEVPYGSSTNYAIGAQLALDVGLFDLNRIEVLRGPQGTLYGASTMGGLIKYVTKQPDASRFGVDVQAGISGTQHGGINYNGSAAINAPIVTDKVALRVSGFESHDGGYIDNVGLGQDDVNQADIFGGRADLLFTPTDALDIRLVGFLQNIERDGETASDHTVSGVPLYGDLNQNRVLNEPFTQRFRLVSGTVNYDLSWATLTSVSSYQSSRTQIIWDRSATLLAQFATLGPFDAIRQNFDLPLDRHTQEVRLASNGRQTLEWVIGGYYTLERSKNIGRYTGLPTGFNIVRISIPSRYEEYAAFGDLTWRLSDKFDVTGGVRYAPNRMTFSQTGTGSLGQSAPTSRSEDDVLTYLANARYHFSNRKTAYVRYATGYRPGGPNVVTTATDLPSYDADRLKSYEVGFKAETATQRFGVDIAGYYIDWDQFQLAFGQRGFSAFTNAAGGASVKGAELGLTARPAAGFTVTGTFAYQRAQLTAAEPRLGAAKGARLPNVPRLTAALNADYELPGSLRPTVGATLRYADDRTNRLSGAIYQLPDYTTVDLRAGFTLKAVDVRLYVRNLLDERGELSAVQFRNPPAPAILQPRTLGINATTHF